MDSYFQINNFSSVFELFVAYYFAFVKLEYLKQLADGELENKPTLRIEKLLKSIQERMKFGGVFKNSYFTYHNKKLNKKTDLGNDIFENFYKRINGIKHKPVWAKVEEKYRPIYLFFGFYSLTILLLGGVEASIIDNLPISIKGLSQEQLNIFREDRIKLKYIYFYLFYLNWAVLVLFGFIYHFQKVDKKNGKPSFFYRDPNGNVFFLSILMIVFFFGGYKYIAFYKESWLTALVDTFDININLFLFKLTKKSFIFFLVGTCFFPSIAVYIYPSIRGLGNVIKAYFLYVSSIVMVWAAGIFLKFINNFINKRENSSELEDEENDILKNLNIPED